MWFPFCSVESIWVWCLHRPYLFWRATDGWNGDGFQPPPLFTINFGTLIEHVAGRRRILHDGWRANRSGVRLRACCRDQRTGVAVVPPTVPTYTVMSMIAKLGKEVLLHQRSGAGSVPAVRPERRQLTALCVDM